MLKLFGQTYQAVKKEKLTMKKSKWSMLLGLIAILAMLALVACGGQATPETPAEEEAPAEEAPPRSLVAYLRVKTA